MSDPRHHLAFLREELQRWVRSGILTAEQERQILGLYPERAPSPRTSALTRLPAILISAAVLLIGVGMILYYAANWRKMPPVAKLIQIFGVLGLCYGGSYYGLFVRGSRLIGRGLLVLGMIGFGAAIGLVAQTYHISAHPTNGILIWLIGTLLLAAVTEERWGYYLCLILAMVWNCWERFEYGNANAVFLLFPLVLGYLFYRLKSQTGMILAGAEALFWFYQVQSWLVERGPEAAIPTLIFLHLPLGVVLVALGRLCGRPGEATHGARRASARPVLAAPGVLLSALGWLFLFLPLIALSWPVGFSFHFAFLDLRVWPLITQHLLCSCLAAVLLVRLRREGAQPIRLLALSLAYGLLLLLAPIGHKATLLALTHLGLLGLILGLLHQSYADPVRRPLERSLAVTFALVALFAKGIGLLVMGLIYREYYVAYCLGFVIFATVLYLECELARQLLQGSPGADRYPARLLGGCCALAVFLMIYAVSFEVPRQTSIFRAELFVIVLVALFIVLGLLFYGLLWRRGAERLPLALSGTIFLTSTLVIFGAGPSIPWEAYSLLFNLLLFIFDATLIYYSVRINSVLLANVALGALVLQVITRYFDLFWDLLSGSLLFIVTGLVVFIGGFLLERNRRRLVDRIRASTPPAGGAA